MKGNEIHLRYINTIIFHNSEFHHLHVRVSQEFSCINNNNCRTRGILWQEKYDIRTNHG